MKDNRSNPLIEYDVKAQVNQLQAKYISLDRQITQLKQYAEQMLKSSLREYSQFSADLTYQKSKVEKDVEAIDTIVSGLKNAQVVDDADLKKKISKMLGIIKERLPEKKKSLKALLTEIKDYEKRFIDENNEETHSEEGGSNLSRNSMDSLKNHAIRFTEYKSNKFIEERNHTFEKIKETTAKALDLSFFIQSELDNQGDIMDNVEDRVNAGKENVIKGEEEIKKVEEITKKQQKRIILLFIVLLALVALIIVLVRNCFV